MRFIISSVAILIVSTLGCGGDSTGPNNGGDGTVSEAGPFTAISANANGTCAVVETRDAYCWGSNAQGTLGNGSGGGNVVPGSPVPVLVAGDLSVISLATGSHHRCVVSAMGGAYCWGRNDEGELGNRSVFFFSDVPLPVTGDYVFSSISAGQLYTCAVTTSHDAYCWGSNSSGQLGDGSRSARFSPALVSGSLAFESVIVGNHRTCGVTTSGAGYCWGAGPLGDETTADRNEPTPVSGGLTLVSIVPGFSHTCGLTTDNIAYCWGFNDFGQLGDGTDADSTVPVRVAGDLAFTNITAGDAHTCAVTTGGDAYCWGANARGQLGNGSTTGSDVPVAVAGVLSFESVSGRGMAHTCGVTTNGAAYCWGFNRSGELGDGTQTDSAVPVRVSDPDLET